MRAHCHVPEPGEVTRLGHLWRVLGALGGSCYSFRVFRQVSSPT